MSKIHPYAGWLSDMTLTELGEYGEYLATRLRDVLVSRREGIDLDLVGEEPTILGEDVGEEYGDDCSGVLDV
jgi:hypothetical protein